ncbi:MAG: DUF882 domain-containing protein [Rhodospirillales bacterium]|nr:MAG: DUF882 domain-containing protein [Rhodospirillales bacterium]
MAEVQHDPQFSRRQFVGFGIATLATLTPLSALASAPDVNERALAFQHLHTGESVKTVYWTRSGYIPEALKDINFILRDFRTDDIKAIDPGLLDFLFAMRRRLGTARPFEVISAYRSPRTNSALAQNSRGVAQNSLHMRGQAVDVRISGVGTRSLARLAQQLQAGGVGYYPRSNFVHVDVGRVRSWGI